MTQEDTGKKDKTSLGEITEMADYLDASTEKEEWDLSKDDQNIYPINASSKEWSKFDSHDEMLAACNIPEDLLTNMSIDDLIKAIINYPLISEIYAYDTI